MVCMRKPYKNMTLKQLHGLAKHNSSRFQDVFKHDEFQATKYQTPRTNKKKSEVHTYAQLR